MLVISSLTKSENSIWSQKYFEFLVNIKWIILSKEQAVEQAHGKYKHSNHILYTISYITKIHLSTL